VFWKRSKVACEKRLACYLPESRVLAVWALQNSAVRYARVRLTYGSTTTSRRSFGRTSELELNLTSWRSFLIVSLSLDNGNCDGKRVNFAMQRHRGLNSRFVMKLCLALKRPFEKTPSKYHFLNYHLKNNIVNNILYVLRYMKYFNY